MMVLKEDSEEQFLVWRSGRESREMCDRSSSQLYLFDISLSFRLGFLSSRLNRFA